MTISSRSTTRLCAALAVVYAGLVTWTLAYFITRIPLQLSDGASNMFSVADISPGELFLAKASSGGFFRPLMWPPYRIVMDLSHGAYFAWFKGIQVLQVFVLLLVFVRWLRVKTPIDLVALPFAIAVLIGWHTFAGTVRELFPINHFLSIAICCLAAAALAAEPRRVVNDVLAVLLFVYAVLTLETGLLVWVILAWAVALGWRGVSTWAVALVTAGVAGYVVIRFGWFQTGTPGLIERSSGFGFEVLEPEELVRRFGQHPISFYAYNLVSATSDALFAEPRAGLWVLTRGLVRHTWEPWMLLNVCCAAGVIALVLVYAWRRRAAWRAYRLTDADRVVLMLPVVVLANAAFCYVYIKDVVMSVSGVFIAAAAFVALREVLSELSRRRLTLGTAVVALALGALAGGWAVKEVGIHCSVWRNAVNVRREWAFVDRWLARQSISLDTPRQRALKAALEREALVKLPPPAFPEFPWSPAWFDENQ